MAAPIGIKIPLTRDERTGYTSLDTYPETVKQNLKNLLLTNQGERVMEPLFGVGIRHKLFEQKDSSTYAKIDSSIREQVRRYLPYLDLQEISFKEDDQNAVFIRIVYFITPLGTSDTLEITE